MEGGNSAAGVPAEGAGCNREQKVRLRGGSLSGTYLVCSNGKKKIRKEIFLDGEREYGFVRWHSQLKKMQRLSSIFPGMFPKVLDFGLDGRNAYYELEFIDGAQSGFEFLASNPSKQEVDRFLSELIAAMDRLHGIKRESSRNSIALYIYEEIERPLAICSKDPKLKQFLEYKTIIFNGKEVPSVLHNLDSIYKIGKKCYQKPDECFTHGNITLENLLWAPSENRVLFIDLYEENISDNIYNEYSQILQSSNSHYEIYNSLDAKIDGNRVALETGECPSIEYFNRNFIGFLRSRLDYDEMRIVKLYEMSQFTRMLPFKLHVARDKMIFFYALASSLLNDLITEVGNNE